MHMLRHHYVPDQPESRLIANPGKLAHKRVPCANRLQQRQPTVTTERNKMQMAFAAVAL
jgi:hypothetical protein